MKKIPNTTQCKPLDHVSPTLAADLEQCMYKAGQKRTSQYQRYFEKTPPAYLGIVAHRVINRAFNTNDLNNLKDENLRETAERFWEEEIENLLSENNLDPEDNVSSWPNYGMKKARTVKEAEKILKEATLKKDSQVKETLVKIEKNIEDESGKIFGRPDRFYKMNSKLVVEEFKSGNIRDDEGEVLNRFRKQILIYCWLVENEIHQWPDLARIQTLEGPSYQEKPIKAESKEIVQGVLNNLNRYNNKLKNLSSKKGDQFEELADPSKEACKWCRIRGWCRLYWDTSVPEKISSEYREDVQGKLQNDWSSPTSMKLSIHGGKTFELGLDPQLINRQKELSSGTLIRCINARVDSKNESYLADDYSEVWWGEPN